MVNYTSTRSEHQRIQVRVRRWTLGSAESGSLKMGKPKRAEVLASPCHTVLTPISPNEDLLWVLQCRPLVIVPTPCCSIDSTGLLGDRLGGSVREARVVGHTRIGSFSAPCTNRTAVDKCFHLAGRWLPSLTLMIRVHTSHCYCVNKVLSPLKGGGQEIIIAWHTFLLQYRPRAVMGPALWLQWDSIYLCSNNNNDCISSK